MLHHLSNDALARVSSKYNRSDHEVKTEDDFIEIPDYRSWDKGCFMFCKDGSGMQNYIQLPEICKIHTIDSMGVGFNAMIDLNQIPSENNCGKNMYSRTPLYRTR